MTNLDMALAEPIVGQQSECTAPTRLPSTEFQPLSSTPPLAQARPSSKRLELCEWTLDCSSGTVVVDDNLAGLLDLRDTRSGDVDTLVGRAVAERDRAKVNAWVRKLRDERPEFARFEFCGRKSTGESCWCDVRAAASAWSEDGRVCSYSGVVIDISRTKAAEEELRVAATAFEAHGAVFVANEKFNIVRVSQGFTDLCGYENAVLERRPFVNLLGSRPDTGLDLDVTERFDAQGHWEGELWLKPKLRPAFPVYLALSVIRGANGEITHYIGNVMDITDRLEAHKEIERLALYDSVTGLPNRTYLTACLDAASAACRESNQRGAVIFIDLDRFKNINDSLGHSVGDALLYQAARRIERCLSKQDILCRVGADEFVVIMTDLGNDETSCRDRAADVVHTIQLNIAQPIAVEGQVFNLTVSVGIALVPGDDKQDVLKQAAVAARHAIAAGRNTTVFFDDGMAEQAVRRIQIEHDLANAIREQQFELYFQPQMDNDARIRGVEALLRWHHPKLGLLSPAEFIDIAEDSYLIHDVGRWILHGAFAAVRRWLNNGVEFGDHLSVNVSAKQFAVRDFVEMIETVRAQYGIAPERIVLELTERATIVDIDETVRKLKDLKNRGYRLAIDDFGTGYSSLAYLRRLPVDQLKIDRAFVRDIADNRDAAAIAEAVITMGANLSMDTIAEGVETAEQQMLLFDKGCYLYQGFLYCRPMDEDALLAYCDEHR